MKYMFKDKKTKNILIIYLDSIKSIKITEKVITFYLKPGIYNYIANRDKGTEENSWYDLFLYQEDFDEVISRLVEENNK